MDFDQVMIDQEDGMTWGMTKEEFLQMPLEARMDLLCKGRVRFFKGGQGVSPLQAMRRSG